MAPPTQAAPSAAGSYTALLRRRSFAALLTAQFLGIFNDNFFKMIVLLLAVGAGLAAEDGSRYLSLGSAVFMVPYLLFSGYAGYAADLFDKRSVLVVTKLLEVVVMTLGLLALLSGKPGFLIVILFLMALQSTFFSPAKYGILPETLPASELSRANGLLELARFLALILGTAIGGVVLAAWQDHPAWIGLSLIVVAVAGTLASLMISAVPRSGSQKPFRVNPWAEIGSGIARIARDRALATAVAGLTFFDFIGTLVLLDLLLVAKEIMALNDARTGLMGAFLGIGIGLGCFVAGRLSGDRVETGLVLIGSVGIGLTLLVLAGSTGSWAQTVFVLTLAGFAGGIFFLPLNALIQQRSGLRERGHVIATNNFLNMGGVFVASGALWVLRDVLEIPADGIILACGMLALAVSAAIIFFLPEYVTRTFAWTGRLFGRTRVCHRR